MEFSQRRACIAYDPLSLPQIQGSCVWGKGHVSLSPSRPRNLECDKHKKTVGYGMVLTWAFALPSFKPTLLAGKGNCKWVVLRADGRPTESSCNPSSLIRAFYKPELTW